MITVQYDGSFDGFLSAVFECYRHGWTDVQLRPQDRALTTLFGESITVATDLTKAARVWQGLQRRLSADGLKQFYHNFLSGVPDEEDNLLAFLRHAFSKAESIEGDFAHPAVLRVAKLARQMHREKHRMEAFVRFELLADGLFYATIEPDFNVLPLIAPHFQSRYADQRWLIYDKLRKQGIYYDLEKVETVKAQVVEDESAAGGIALELDAKEKLYQHLWKDYFVNTNIPARKNLKLQLQHVPTRYWKYLTEKKLS